MSLSYLRHFLRVQKPTGLARAYQPLRCTVQRRFSTTATSTVTANHETFSSFSEPPPEEFSQYYSHNPVDEWRRMVPKQYWNNVDNTLIQRQLEKERNAVNEAVERYHQMMEDVTQLGKGANLRPAEMVIMEWFRGSLCDAIAKVSYLIFKSSRFRNNERFEMERAPHLIVTLTGFSFFN